MPGIPKIVRFIASPTRFAFDTLKGEHPQEHPLLYTWWPPAFLFAALLAIPIFVITKPHPLRSFGLRDWFVVLVLWVWPYSRIAEIEWAFIGEINQRLKPQDPTSPLTVSQRLGYLLLSYFELIIAFAALYYFLPANQFQFRPGSDTPSEMGFSNFFQAVYFSGMTITTTGYGDIIPRLGFAEFFSMLEPLTGLVLVAGGISTYMATIQLGRREEQKVADIPEAPVSSVNMTTVEHLGQRINQLNKKCTQVLLFLSFAIAAAVILWTSNSTSLDAAHKAPVFRAMKLWVAAIFPTLVGVAPFREICENNLRWYTWLRWIKFVALWAAVICIGWGVLEFARAI